MTPPLRCKDESLESFSNSLHKFPNSALNSESGPAQVLRPGGDAGRTNPTRSQMNPPRYPKSLHLQRHLRQPRAPSRRDVRPHGPSDVSVKALGTPARASAWLRRHQLLRLLEKPLSVSFCYLRGPEVFEEPLTGHKCYTFRTHGAQLPFCDFLRD